jgi:hypothetical protein
LLEHLGQGLAFDLCHPISIREVSRVVHLGPGQIVADVFGHHQAALQGLAQRLGVARVNKFVNQVAFSFNDFGRHILPDAGAALLSTVIQVLVPKGTKLVLEKSHLVGTAVYC